MPYKDPEAKRRYMSRYYVQKIKPGAIPCTAYRKRSYGLTNSYANKTQDFSAAILAPKSPEDNKPRRPKRRGGAEYRELIPKGFTSLGNGVVMRFIKPDET
jgi:hypothetical protein